MVADHYCLRDACADVDRRNARAATEADRTNRPARPLPSGIVVLCALIGLAIAATVVRLRDPQIAHQVTGWMP